MCQVTYLPLKLFTLIGGFLTSSPPLYNGFMPYSFRQGKLLYAVPDLGTAPLLKKFYFLFEGEEPWFKGAQHERAIHDLGSVCRLLRYPVLSFIHRVHSNTDSFHVGWLWDHASKAQWNSMGYFDLRRPLARYDTTLGNSCHGKLGFEQHLVTQSKM